MMTPMRWTKRIVPGLCFFCLSGCGYSQLEWDQQLRNAQNLTKEVQEQRQLAAKCSDDSSAARLQLDQLRSKMLQRGVRLDHLEEDLERQQLAGREYEARSLQLSSLQGQVARLQQSLLPLSEQGVRIVARDNQLAIRFPAAILFPFGSTTLSAAGHTTLEVVVRALQSNGEIARRTFQVAGHTDPNLETPKGAGDKWAFTAMQARAVLLAVSSTLNATSGAKVGGWSAAGFAGSAPISRNETPAEQLRNQRIEIVVQPLADEMLNLSGLSLLR